MGDRVFWTTIALSAFLIGGSAIAANSPHPSAATATTSRVCLECHDGVIASNVLAASSATAAPLGTPGGTHPVAVDYLAAQTSGSAKLRPLSLLPSEIRLVDGRVECISCHDLSTDSGPRLVIEMTKSRLCFACHAL